jgi:hypothetical protein
LVHSRKPETTALMAGIEHPPDNMRITLDISPDEYHKG